MPSSHILTMLMCVVMDVVHSGIWQTMVKYYKVMGNKSKSTAENLVRAGRAGGIETVFKVINIHISNADVCSAVCCALCNMPFNHGKT